MTKINEDRDRAAIAAAQWRAERPDIDAFPMEVIGRLTELGLIIARDRLNPIFAKFGLQNGEFDVLATLRRTGGTYSLTPTALYQATMISSGGMTARIDRLEKAGLIERSKHPTDRRGTLVGLTERGKALIDEMLEVHVENERAVLAPLTSDEQKTLNDILRKLINGSI
ncbi:MarR family winged helix-turn-helix transcriptional regulator [Puniceicoccus vermicola]|uniref:MarR family transcriptional regulator n=1 Tax=Puniceicoccus vermicola TaxID=388746 RepID=A0A7X1AX95_9BACT|nr:MarR family transcriptional regulator [Puniceicoccus vermicola]MBC2601562.1 MarR family transcriptional regulator [Puniceicoccus vermicola]